MTRLRSRRRFLATVTPVALAGCLVEQGTDGSQELTDDESVPEAETNSEQTPTPTDEAEGSSSAVESGESTSADDRASLAEAAGISIEETDILRIVESVNLSQIVVDVTVRNDGERTYGTLELRVDAYYEPPEDDRMYHPPRVDERTAVGREYFERTFESFDDETRVFEDVVVQYDADDANGSVAPAEFTLEVAVRRADPL